MAAKPPEIAWMTDAEVRAELRGAGVETAANPRAALKAVRRNRGTARCPVCGGSPVVSATGLCGPCTFGTAAAAGGEW